MLTVMPIKSIAYHDAQANETERHAAHFYGDEASRNLVSTYYDRDISGARGRWLLLGSTAGSAPSVFDEIDAGAPVLARHLHALAAGAAITQERSVREKSGDRRAGYDCVFAVPKSVSILIALGDHALTRAVVEAHENAVVQAMKYAFAAGCIEIRTGAAGRYRQAAKACAAPMYTHFLSRENDVQLHTHVVILNAGLRADGTVSAIDNLKFMQMRAIIAARYRAALADNLYSKLGLESENVERNFELVDCDSSLRDVFSKRKQQIDSYVAAAGTTTARSRTIAQKAAYETRRKKQLGLVLPLLQKDWQRQIDEAGFSPDRMLQLIRSRAASRTLSISDRDQLLRRRTLEAIDGATALNCVIPARVFEQKIFEAGQSFGSVAAIETVVIDLSEKFIVGVRDGTGDQYHIAKESVHLEHALLNTARQGRQKWLQPASLTDAVKRRADLSDEQLVAALHALNSDLVAVVEGSPGSGKSHLLGAVTDALRGAGLNVLVTAPSHKAKAVIRVETKTDDARAMPIQTMARKLRAGSLAFDERDVIIIDEGGMTALCDVNEVVQAAAKVGAKIIMSGDTKQLQPVAAGAPMLSLAKLLGSARVGEIRRQKVSWMRAASQDLVTDNVDLAIHEYRDHGAIQLRPSAQETLFSAADRAMHLALRQSELPAAEAMPLVMTHRRKDVLALNAAIRQKLKAQGELATSITINAMMKGDYASTELEIATGDKVVFGENLEIAGIAINNGDIANVTAITKAAGIDPVLHFRLDRRDSESRPITFEAKPRDLVGYRKDRQLRIPRLQHAYAVTVYGSQGATVDHAILVCTARTSAEQVLVGMTRHRFGLDVFVAADRLLPQELRRSIGLKTSGEIVNIDVEQTLTALSPAQEAQAIRGFIREASERENKLNPSDFVKDVHAWLDEPDAVTGFRRWQQPTSLDVFKGRLNRLSQKPPVPKIALNGIASDSFNASELAAIEAAHQKDRCQMMNIAHDHEPSAAAAMAIGQNPMRTPQERAKTLGRLATRTKTAIRDKLQLWVLNPIASALKRVDEGDRARRTARPRPTFKFAPGMMLACQLQIAIRQIEEAQALENMTRRMARRRSMLVALLADPAAQTKSRQSEVQPLGQPTPSLGATSEPHRQSPMVGDVETRHPAKSGRNKSWIANGFEKLASVGRELINRTTTTAAEATLRKPPDLTDSKKAAAILDPQRRAESPVERVVHAPAGSKTAPQPGATLAETDGRRQKSSSDGFWMPPAEDVFVFDPVSGRLVPAGQVSLAPASYGREGVDVQSVRKDSLIVSSNSLRPPQIPADARVDPAVIPKGHEAAKRPAATPARPSSGPLRPAWKRKDDGRGI